MKPDLLEKIQALGHWRVNIRPLADRQELLSLANCRAFVERSSVSLRGWDFPHINNRNDDDGGMAPMGAYFESWTDWDGFIDFWRMYRSSQFLAYIAVHSDTGPMGTEIADARQLGAVEAIYAITEFIEFAHRLSTNGLYEAGAIVSVALRNTANRRLTAGQGKIPFFDLKQTGAAAIQLDRNFTVSDLTDRHRDMSVSMILELFDQFGWNPGPERILSEQERFYSRNFSG
jgi:hypothetical protein